MTTIQPNRSMSDAFEGFVLAKKGKRVTANTHYLYNWSHALWKQRWGEMDLSAVTAEHVRRFVVWLQGQDDGLGAPPAPATAQGGRLSSSSVHNIYRNLRTLFNWCAAEGLVDRSPMANVEAPIVEERLPSVLTEAEANNLLDCVLKSGDRNAFRDYVIHLFFLSTAVRLSELHSLNLDDLHLMEGYCKVFGKNRRERLVSLGEVLPVEIKRYLLKHRAAKQGEVALFTNERGQRLGRRGIQSIVSRDLRQHLNRTLSHTGPHTFRHTSITFRLRQTGDLERTRLAAGHRDVRITQRYTHLAQEDVLNGSDGQPWSPMDAVRRKASRESARKGRAKGGTNLEP